jgi:hypothetical protein
MGMFGGQSVRRGRWKWRAVGNATEHNEENYRRRRQREGVERGGTERPSHFVSTGGGASWNSSKEKNCPV